jgi:hypothetical protein
MPTDAECGTGDVVYYNASVFIPHDSPVTPAKISDIRDTPIIYNPEDYDMSVVRFDISANLVPAVIAPMASPIPAIGPAQPTQWWVSLTVAGVPYQANITIPILTLDTWGYLYTIDAVLKRVNTAFADAFAGIPGPTVASPPIFAYNPKTQLISLYVGGDYLTAAGAPLVWVSSSLYSYIPSIPSSTFNGFNNPDKLDFQLRLDGVQSITLGAGPAYVGSPLVIQGLVDAIQIPQSGPSMDSWNGVRSIFITSSSIPITNEYLPNFNGSAAQAQNSSSASLPIVSDFLLSADARTNPVVDRIRVSYLPTAEYRIVTLGGHKPLRNIDLQFWYSDHDGNRKPLNLAPGGYASVKLMFRKR